jgi:hypothetical protein
VRRMVFSCTRSNMPASTVATASSLATRSAVLMKGTPYTRPFKYPHSKEPDEARSGDRGGHSRICSASHGIFLHRQQHAVIDSCNSVKSRYKDLQYSWKELSTHFPSNIPTRRNPTKRGQVTEELTPVYFPHRGGAPSYSNHNPSHNQRRIFKHPQQNSLKKLRYH